VRKAYTQDPKAVAEWLEETYPQIERRAAKGGGEIHWGDETGVRSTCQHSRGYARPQHTPELGVPAGRFSVNMISTVTNQGRVRWMIHQGKMNAPLFLAFLTRLLAGAAKEVFLIVDHLSVHEAAAVEEWLADKRGRVEVFYLPKYTPERNPDEYLNCDVKGNINTDGLPKDREELRSKHHAAGGIDHGSRPVRRGRRDGGFRSARRAVTPRRGLLLRQHGLFDRPQAADLAAHLDLGVTVGAQDRLGHVAEEVIGAVAMGHVGELRGDPRHERVLLVR